MFIKQARPEIKWRHEDGSVKMLRYIVASKGIKWTEYGLSDIDIVFIEEMIAGTKDSDRRGRPPEKRYLYGLHYKFIITNL